MPVQVLAILYRRVEERRAEEEMPANRNGRGRHRMNLPGSAAVADGAHGGSENDGPRSRADTRQLALEPPRWKRDVVGIQARDVPPPCLLQASIERARETEPRLVSNDAQARVTNPGDDIRRGIGRAVVDHHELEIGDGLPENALEAACT